ncbi:DHH family phosphoesterase [Guggenheimella bovis]
MKDPKRFTRELGENFIIVVIILAVLNVLLYVAKPDFGYVGIAISMAFILYSLYRGFEKRSNWEKFMREREEELSESHLSGIVNMPLPLVILDENGVILWYNSLFRSFIPGKKDLINKPITELFPEWKWNELQKTEESYFEENMEEKSYRIYRTVSSLSDPKLFTLYWIDITEYKKLEQQYQDEKPLFAHVQVDNLDEILKNAEEGSAPFIISEVTSVLKEWANRNEAILQRVDEDEYNVTLQSGKLIGMEKRRFQVLDDIRRIDRGNKSPITLSIGLSHDGEDIIERDLLSRKALELALGRGGDQAVVRQDGSYQFFGGRSKSVERINRVRSRVIAQSLKNLVADSENIYIMGHRYPDLDCFSAAVGLSRSMINLGKHANIIMNEVTESVSEVYNMVKALKEHRFVKSSEIKNHINEKDILIIVDTHRPTFTDDPELLGAFKTKVVIDHHRRGTEFIESPALTYLEPYASSTAEMVAELIQYISDKPRLEPEEANVLLAGIVLDTKNFVFNTGVRTFDAASYLRRQGADTQVVREIFKDKFEESILTSQIVSNSVLIREGIAVSMIEEPVENISKIISIGADELIDIRGIHTSFVLGMNVNKKIFLSARSNGNINVQVVTEKLGGGGHLEVAGAQFENTTLEEVRARLIQALDEYLEEQ